MEEMIRAPGKYLEFHDGQWYLGTDLLEDQEPMQLRVPGRVIPVWRDGNVQLYEGNWQFMWTDDDNGAPHSTPLVAGMRMQRPKE